DCHDTEQSVLSYIRYGAGQMVIVVLNFTPVPRHGYRIGVPCKGRYRELCNSDSNWYGGANLGNCGGVDAEPQPWMDRPYSLSLTLPPLAGLIMLAEDARLLDSGQTRQ